MFGFEGRYLPLVLIFMALLACGAIWLSIRWHRGRQPENDPYKSRIRQAVRFGWKQEAEVPEDGFGAAWTQRSIRFVRGNEEAVLWHKDVTITLVRVDAPFNFADFDDAEKWIRANPIAAEVDTATEEELYLREIEKFVVRHGHYMSFLETRASDKDFLTGFLKLYKAGYRSRENPRLIAGLMLEALAHYPKDRDKALRHLSGFAMSVNPEPRTDCNQTE
jgi:hypothetical protein